MKDPPAELVLGDSPSEEERARLARWLVANVEWKAPLAAVNDAHKAFCDDLNTMTFIAQVTGVEHGQVRVMRDEYLADAGTLQQEQHARDAFYRRMGERTRLSLTTFYRHQRHHAARHRPRASRVRQRSRERRPGATRRTSSSSSTSSDPPDSGDDLPAAASRVNAAARGVRS